MGGINLGDAMAEMVHRDPDSFLNVVLEKLFNSALASIEMGYTLIDIKLTDTKVVERFGQMNESTRDWYLDAVSRGLEARGFCSRNYAILDNGNIWFDLRDTTKLCEEHYVPPETDDTIVKKIDVELENLFERLSARSYEVPLLGRFLKIIYGQIYENVKRGDVCAIIEFEHNAPVMKDIRFVGNVDGYHTAVSRSLESNGFVVEKIDLKLSFGKSRIYVGIPEITVPIPVKHDITVPLRKGKNEMENLILSACPRLLKSLCWSKVSCNPLITPEFVDQNLNLSWSWGAMSKNPNLTAEFIVRHDDKSWDWGAISECTF